MNVLIQIIIILFIVKHIKVKIYFNLKIFKLKIFIFCQLKNKIIILYYIILEHIQKVQKIIILFKQLKANNYIDTETFYIKYNEDNDEEGEIIFGYENYIYLVKNKFILQYKAQEQIKIWNGL